MIENICRLALGDTDTSGTEEDTSLRDSGADTESSTETDAETDIKKTPADSEAETVGGRTETDKTDSPETKSEERTEPSEKTEDEVLVLILHTHTTEAYRDGADPAMPGRSLDSAQNMLAVGQALEDALAAHGIGAVQCTAVFDYPSVIGAYDRAYGEAGTDACTLSEHQIHCWTCTVWTTADVRLHRQWQTEKRLRRSGCLPEKAAGWFMDWQKQRRCLHCFAAETRRCVCRYGLRRAPWGMTGQVLWE